MQMPRPTDEAKERFRDVVPDDPRVEVRPMFGQLGAFLGGHMFAGLFGSDIGVKLPGADLAELRARGAQPFGPAERPMGGYVTVPEGEDAAALLRRAADHAASLPPKAPTAPTAPKAPKKKM